MVDTIINHLAKSDQFWRQTLCRAGKPSISPHVKFLCAQKMLCYGISSSAFVEYFQMGETTSRRCLSKLTRGMVDCNALVNDSPPLEDASEATYSSSDDAGVMFIARMTNETAAMVDLGIVANQCETK
jgi:hypothetical protein